MPWVLFANLTHAWSTCIKVNLFEIKPSHCIYWNNIHCLLVFSSFDMFCKFYVLWKNVQLYNPKCHCNKLYFACMWCLICWCNCNKVFDLLSSHNATYVFNVWNMDDTLQLFTRTKSKSINQVREPPSTFFQLLNLWTKVVFECSQVWTFVLLMANAKVGFLLFQIGTKG